MQLPFFTIAQSTRAVCDFGELLRAGEVQMVIDIRTVPVTYPAAQPVEARAVRREEVRR